MKGLPYCSSLKGSISWWWLPVKPKGCIQGQVNLLEIISSVACFCIHCLALMMPLSGLKDYIQWPSSECDGIKATYMLFYFYLGNLASSWKYGGERIFSSKNSKVLIFFQIKKIERATCRKLPKYSKKKKKKERAKEWKVHIMANIYWVLNTCHVVS